MNALSKFADKSYRDGFVQHRVRGGIAYQLQALRTKFGLTQTEFAQRTGKTQTGIDHLESTAHGDASVQDLLDIASGLDVALLVRFVSYPEFLERTADMSVEALQPATVFESLAAPAGVSEKTMSKDDHEELTALRGFVAARGYRRCDNPVCNCGSWHGGHANDRLIEISE